MDFVDHIQILNHGMWWSVQTDAAALGRDMHSHAAAPWICPLKSTDWWKSWEVACRLKNDLPSMPACGRMLIFQAQPQELAHWPNRAWRANPPTAWTGRGWSPTHVLLLASSLLTGSNENSLHLQHQTTNKKRWMLIWKGERKLKKRQTDSEHWGGSLVLMERNCF